MPQRDNTRKITEKMFSELLSYTPQRISHFKSEKIIMISCNNTAVLALTGTLSRSSPPLPLAPHTPQCLDA